MSAKWEPWDPTDPPPITLRDVGPILGAIVVFVLIFATVIYGLPIIAAAIGTLR